MKTKVPSSFFSRALTLCLLLITAPGCAQTFALNERFDLRVGEYRILNDSGFSIRFIAVEGDGRCPIDATCVWQGDAEVKFEVGEGGPTHTVTLHTSGHRDMPNQVKILGRTISLVKLVPYPEGGKVIGKEDYVATLSVT